MKDASSNLANIGNFGFALSTSSHDCCNSSWIIDLGTKNHMTHESSCFLPIALIPEEKKKGKLVKWNLFYVGGRFIPLASSMSLSTILHVPLARSLRL